MSTKNLARTVIEGGRHRYNKWERRHSHAEERFHERMTSSAALSLHDIDAVVYPLRKKVFRAFDDKLAPAERWLRSQAGRPWSKVRSELLARFDTRTTAGRHILFCHLLRELEPELRPWRRPKFSVDRHGILRAHSQQRSRFWTPPVRLPEPKEMIRAWLAGRQVGERDGAAYWFTPTVSGSFRQGRRLEDADLARWRHLPDWFRERHDALLGEPFSEES